MTMNLADPAIAAAYLSAMVDGEGHVKSSDKGDRAISVANTDRAIVDACVSCCITLGIEPRVYTVRTSGSTKDCYIVSITSRDNIERAAAVLDLQAPAKAARLLESAASYRYGPPCSSSELRGLYEGKLMSVAEIARRFGRSQTSIWHWMSRYGIQKRSRGEASRIAWAARRA